MGEDTGGVWVSECVCEGHEGAHAKGSDHSPVLAWLSLEGANSFPSQSWWTAAGRGQTQLSEDAQEHGNDATYPTQTQAREPPPMCASFLPEARRKQTSITSLFMNAIAAAPPVAIEHKEDGALGHSHMDIGVSLPGRDMPAKGAASGGQNIKTYLGNGGASKKPKTSLGKSAAARQKREEDSGAPSIMPEEWAQLGYQGKAGASTAGASTAPNSLLGFFTRLDTSKEPAAAAPRPACSSAHPAARETSRDAGGEARAPTRDQDIALGNVEPAGRQAAGTKDGGEAASEALKKCTESSRGAAAAEWSKILCMKKTNKGPLRPPASAPKYLSEKEQKAFLATAAVAPLCPGHSEPTIQRLVQKPGANQGRRFWVCARPNGAPGQPAARCDFFKWC